MQIGRSELVTGVLIASLLCGVGGCFGWPDDEDHWDDLDRYGPLGEFATRPGGLGCGVGAYDGVQVFFGPLQACSNETVPHVELTPVRLIDQTLSWSRDREAIQALPDDELLAGSPLPDRVPATRDAVRVWFTAEEIVAATGVARAPLIRAVMRCGDEVVDRRIDRIGEGTMVAGSTVLAAEADQAQFELVHVRDDGGVIYVFSSFTPAGGDLMQLTLRTTTATGARVAEADLGLVRRNRYVERSVSRVHGSAIEAVGDGMFVVRVHDDVVAPRMGWTGLIAADGEIVQAWPGQATVQAERFGQHLVLTHVGLSGVDVEADDDFSSVMGETWPISLKIDVVAVRDGARLFGDLTLDVVADDASILRALAQPVAVSGTGIDVVAGDPPRYHRLSAIDAPRSLPLPPARFDDVSELRVVPLPATTNRDVGRFLWLQTSMRTAKTHVDVLTLDSAQTAVIALNNFGEAGGYLAHVGRSYDRRALALGFNTGGDESVAGSVLVIRDGQRRCPMRSAHSTAPITFTHDDNGADLLLMGGESVVGCDGERLLDAAIDTSPPYATTAGVVDAVRELESLTLVRWLPLSLITAQAPFAAP